MPNYDQADRPLRIMTALGENALLITGFAGHEGVSIPFSYQLELMSENPAVDGEALLRSPACVTVVQADGSERSIHGHIRRFVQLGRHHDLTFYRAELVPWLWFLSLSRDCRIFQDQSVLEILEQVFRDHGFSDYDFRCTQPYPARPYCVQYHESHLDFVSRLMEDEGIFYFFEHTDSKHTLVLADSNSSVAPCRGSGTVRVAEQRRTGEDVILTIAREHAVSAGVVTLGDFDPLQPSLTLRSSIAGNSREEIYEYQSVIYTNIDDGEWFARLRLEAEEAGQRIIRGSGTCRFMESGHRFELRDHYRPDMNESLMILEVRHKASAGDYRAWDRPDFDYTNEFLCIPHSVPYRAPLRTPRPRMRGSQTAVVVGPAGEEVYVDRYGCVKVQFHWDQRGRLDENSSCWVRVSTAWAGKGWGTISIPRIGQEVIVDFLEGDPDRPIITGRVYNAEHVPPYALPDNATQSGVKSRSSKSGGPDNYNEIRMEDRKGGELLYIHAERDKQVVVENNRTESVGSDETVTIGHDRRLTVRNNDYTNVEGNREEHVAADESLSVGGKRFAIIQNDDDAGIGGNRTVDVRGSERCLISGSREHQIQLNERLVIGGDRLVRIGRDYQLRVAGGADIIAERSILLTAGSSFISITPAGITMSTPRLQVTASADAVLAATLTKIQADAMLKVEAPATLVKGSGALRLEGATVLIN